MQSQLKGQTKMLVKIFIHILWVEGRSIIDVGCCKQVY